MADRYAVIGQPIAHSKSPMVHAAFAAQTGQTIEYTAIEAVPGGFADAVDRFRAAGGRGVNITAPFKLDAYAYATKLRDRARLAGAVNALAFTDAEAEADNFDGVGLLRDLERNRGVPLRGKRVLLLGAGGAARGALLPFLQARPAELVIVDRTRAEPHALSEEFIQHGSIVATTYKALAAGRPELYDIVVNATSASLYGELPPVPPSVFPQAALAYELAYGKGLTPFLRLARDAGAGCICDGVGMLVEQAAEAFAWWRGVRPDTRAMIQTLTIPLT